MKAYLKIARPDHWFKNVFVLPGLAFALFVILVLQESPSETGLGSENFSFFSGEAIRLLLIPLIIGMASVCLVASANYTINEYLDAEFDRHHPKKKNRPTVLGAIKLKGVILQYVILSVAGLLLAAAINLQFFLISAFLLVMGVIYNVRPMRSKDRVYMDVLSESINNPIRFMLGWSLVIPEGAHSLFALPGALAAGETTLAAEILFPPSSILLAYWFGGAFLMTIKRFSEYRHINNPELAGLYRESFKYYSEHKLLIASFFYALCSSFFLAIFLFKYRIELLLSFPFIALLFTWYLHIGLKPDSVTQNPEKLYREWRFLLFVCFLCLFIVGLFVVEIDLLKIFLERIEPTPVSQP